MNMTDLRVKIDIRHQDLYRELAENQVVGGSHELFLAAACVGFRLGKRVAPKTREEKFWSRTFTPEEWACLYALAIQLADGDIAAVQDDVAVIKTMEEYATGGLDYLIETSLCDDFVQAGDRWSVERSSVKDLPRQFLYNLWQISQNP